MDQERKFTNEMECIQVTKKSKHYKEIAGMYKEAFPRVERCPLWVMNQNLKKGNAEFLAFLENEKVLGMSYSIMNDEFVYLFYLAVKKEYRGQGNGSRIFQELNRRYGNRCFFLARETLDEKAENYDQRVNRKAFYEKNGFHNLPGHIKEAGVTFDIMGNDGPIGKADYQSLMISWGGTFRTRIYGLKLIEEKSFDESKVSK